MATISFGREEEEDQLLAQALFVDENEIDDTEGDNNPPASGEEYLRKVVKERKKFEVIGTGAICSTVDTCNSGIFGCRKFFRY